MEKTPSESVVSLFAGSEYATRYGRLGLDTARRDNNTQHRRD